VLVAVSSLSASASPESFIGQFADVSITEADDFDLYGTLALPTQNEQ